MPLTPTLLYYMCNVCIQQVKELECETDNRKHVASGGKLDGVINEEQRLQY